MAKKNKKLKRIPGLRQKRKKSSVPPGVSSRQNIFQEALSHHQAGRLSQAEALYRRVLSAEPNHPEALHFFGMISYQTGRSGAAIELVRRALSIRPDYAEAYNTLGTIVLAQGNFNEARANCQQALDLNPDFVEAHYNLGIALYELERLDEAVASFRRALRLNPDLPDCHFNLGLALQALGKLNEAAASYRNALTLKPDFAESYNGLGYVLRHLGKIDDAVACFKKALELKPDFIGAYKNLSESVTFTEVDDVTHAMEVLCNNEDLSDADRVDLGFALGKAFEDLGEYARSFDLILEANRLKRRSYEYSIHEDHEFFEQIKTIFSRTFFSKHHGSGNRDATPIFILGMPRSGTTLVEQILASHPLVFGAGELAILKKELFSDISTGGTAAPFPECMLHLDEDDFERLGSGYIEKIRKYSKDSQHITDKMPHNFVRVGLIRTILPNAKIIHCMRNPMDNCYSIFKTDFTGTHRYAHDMTELGQYYNLYRDLMAHWEKVLPGFMHTVRYEEIVSDQENQTKSLLDYCDLPWDKSCLDFHKTKRRVSTASFAQVRQPLHKNSVELWRRYERQLKPLEKALQTS